MSQENAQFVFPLENDWCDMSWCALDCAWYNDKKLYARPRGITFYIRAHNEEKTIASSIKSLHEQLQPRQVPYDIVFIDNLSTDCTVETARPLLREQDKTVFYTLRLAKPGLENAVTPPNSAHSFVWFTQWCLQQCTRYSHAFRWDADFVMTPALADALQREFATPYVVPNDFYNIRAVHRESGKENREYYLIAVRTRVRYVLSGMWEVWSIPCRRPHKAQFDNDTCIEHCTDIERPKDYQRALPWWCDAEARQMCGNSDWFDAMIAEYEKVHASLPMEIPTFARSHCPKTDILQSHILPRMRKIEGLPD